jgi:hypothetical protein
VHIRTGTSMILVHTPIMMVQNISAPRIANEGVGAKEQQKQQI